MMQSRLRVSLVIPAYNEESHLSACLAAVARQTVRPFEVIVVDNASTDRTAAVAAAFPFVRVVREPRRGISRARDAGFAVARGDIVGRIDVDTLLEPDWVARVAAIFADPSVDAVSGSIGFYDVPFRSLFERVDLFFRSYLARSLSGRGELFLYGSNMAIRRKVWQAIRPTLCHERHFHEDIDMAAHLAHSPYRVVFDAGLRVQVSARRVDSSPGSYYPYVVANSRTYAAHSLRGRYYMYPVEAFAVVAYPVLRLLYRAYDPAAGRFSMRRLYRPAYEERVSPVA